MNALHWLSLTALMTATMWIPYVLDRFARVGIMATLGNPTAALLEQHSEWAQRARKAHYNAVENLVVFAALVGVAAAMNRADEPLVVGAAAVYFWARAIHYVVFTAGVPVARTAAYLVGFGAQVAVGVVLVGAHS